MQGWYKDLYILDFTDRPYRLVGAFVRRRSAKDSNSLGRRKNTGKENPINLESRHSAVYTVLLLLYLPIGLNDQECIWPAQNSIAELLYLTSESLVARLVDPVDDCALEIPGHT